MKRSSFVVLVGFSALVYVLAHTNGREVPFHNPLLLEAYPCRNTKDIIVWFEPGLSSKESYRYYVYINKVVPAHSVVNVTFDHKVNVTFTVQSDETKLSRISLTRGDLFIVCFYTQQEGFGAIVQGLTPGCAPNLIGLTVNDVEYCTNPDMGILHKYHKSGNAPQEKEYIWEAESHSLKTVDLRNCGRRDVDTELVLDGQTKPGAWPWHVALYEIRKGSLTFYCGGTLISKNYVLTAGHCTVDKKAENLVVLLRKYDILDFSEGFTGIGVKKIIVPEGFDSYKRINDISLLKLKKEFDAIAKPACLWYGGPSENMTGVIVGWGFDEDDNFLTNLQQANMPVVSNATCVAGNPGLATILNENNFCAGYSERGTSVCDEDDGTGLVVFKPDDKSDGRETASGSWHVKGVLSYSARYSNDLMCVESFAVFTDVDKFRDWILCHLEE